jgi:hypothetical protein
MADAPAPKPPPPEALVKTPPLSSPYKAPPPAMACTSPSGAYVGWHAVPPKAPPAGVAAAAAAASAAMASLQAASAKAAMDDPPDPPHGVPPGGGGGCPPPGPPPPGPPHGGPPTKNPPGPRPKWQWQGQQGREGAGHGWWNEALPIVPGWPVDHRAPRAPIQQQQWEVVDDEVVVIEALKDLTTLGMLDYVNDPAFPMIEWSYLCFIWRALTTNWYRIQSCRDDVGLPLWYYILQVLEVDSKGMTDLMLLAQSGIVGRTKANEILWNILSYWALIKP